MILWLILVSAAAYGGAILALGRGPLHLNAYLFGAVANFIAVIVPLAWYLVGTNSGQMASPTPKKGLAIAALAGLALGIFTLAITKIFSTGQNVSFVIPLVYGGAVLVASLIGLVAFREQLDLVGATGLVLIVGGIICMAYAAHTKGLIA